VAALSKNQPGDADLVVAAVPPAVP
jgi:hypothetical protein